MKCPHCHKSIKVNKPRTTFVPFDYTGLFVRNLMLWLVPYGIIISALDNYTSLPISMSDGLAANYWLMPMLVIGIGLGIYCFLFEYGKVKGKFLLK